jgi:hypothetical protein
MTTDLPAPDAASGSHRPPLNYYGELARRQWDPTWLMIMKLRRVRRCGLSVCGPR